MEGDFWEQPSWEVSAISVCFDWVILRSSRVWWEGLRLTLKGVESKSWIINPKDAEPGMTQAFWLRPFDSTDFAICGQCIQVCVGACNLVWVCLECLPLSLYFSPLRQSLSWSLGFATFQLDWLASKTLESPVSVSQLWVTGRDGFSMGAGIQTQLLQWVLLPIETSPQPYCHCI